jgi:hypothetical protein
MRAVLEGIDALEGEPIDLIGREALVSAVARAALLGARGNSGVILSQIVRGAAEELASRPGELVDPVLVSAALARAADAAYAAVREPAEGTMLTVVRAMAHAVAHEIAHAGADRRGPDAEPAEQDRLLADVLERALEAGREATERGPEQLGVLRDAGVVDSGAYGICILIAGVIAALREEGGPLALPQPTASGGAAEGGLAADGHGSDRYRWCTNFAVSGEGLLARAFVPPLEALGDSVLVVGDERTLRVHVHTDEPERATALFAEHGEVSRFEATDMHLQVAQRAARLSTGDGPRDAGPARSGRGPDAEAVDRALCGVVAVATGAGVVRLFEQLHAVVVDPGSRFNPSTEELARALDRVEEREALVLTNSADVVLAAEQAAALADRPVSVVPTRSPQTGLAALLAFDPSRSAADNARALTSAARHLRTGGVTAAARDDPAGRFETGDAIGYVGDELVASGDPYETLAAVVGQLTVGAEILTCLNGDGAPLDPDAVARTVPEGVELDLQEGGQPVWWWLLSAE